METSRQKTVTFEFHSTDITPEEMANTFISEDLLAEQHRGLLVEQLIDIARQLVEDPQTVPQVTLPAFLLQSFVLIIKFRSPSTTCRLYHR